MSINSKVDEDCNAKLLISGGVKKCFYGCLGIEIYIVVLSVNAIMLFSDLHVLAEKNSIKATNE